jgi:hypothetical protein
MGSREDQVTQPSELPELIDPRLDELTAERVSGSIAAAALVLQMSDSRSAPARMLRDLTPAVQLLVPAYLPPARRRSWRRRAGSSVDRLFAK